MPGREARRLLAEARETGAIRTVVVGNPFGMDPARRDALVTDAMAEGVPDLEVRFTAYPDQAAAPEPHLVVVLNPARGSPAVRGLPRSGKRAHRAGKRDAERARGLLPGRPGDRCGPRGGTRRGTDRPQFPAPALAHRGRPVPGRLFGTITASASCPAASISASAAASASDRRSRRAGARGRADRGRRHRRQLARLRARLARQRGAARARGAAGLSQHRALRRDADRDLRQRAGPPPRPRPVGRFLERPPPDFADQPLLSPRGMLHVARADQRAALDERRDARQHRWYRPCARLDAAGVRELVPLVSAAYVDGGLLEPDARAIDVALLHQAICAACAAAAAGWSPPPRPTAIRAWRRRLGGRDHAPALSAPKSWSTPPAPGPTRSPSLPAWRRSASSPSGGRRSCSIRPRASIRRLADGDRRRGALLLQARGRAAAGLAGRRDPGRAAADVQPEELDVAIAVDRYETADRPAQAPRLRHRWAGLRSFVADHESGGRARSRRRRASSGWRGRAASAS